MQFAKKPIALAVLALCASAPFAAQAAISVSFKAPASGATLTNVSFNGTSACEVTGTDIKKVVFSLDFLERRDHHAEHGAERAVAVRAELEKLRRRQLHAARGRL
jgi:hypothetical protein